MVGSVDPDTLVFTERKTYTGSGANLAVLQYESGNWSLPIQLTGDSRYLENLSAARLNGDDIVMGMHTAVTITENSVEDAKDLVVSRVMPVSDLRIDGVDYDDSDLTAGESPLRSCKRPCWRTSVRRRRHTSPRA